MPAEDPGMHTRSLTSLSLALAVRAALAVGALAVAVLPAVIR